MNTIFYLHIFQNIIINYHAIIINLKEDITE